jgi:nitroimidazol reductase NimA-like FMN-containing flavoprotein (pyridoxamine 5'-phosphate oxidase superfamily)
MSPFERPEPRAGALDRNGLRVLAREECLALLGTVRLGRVGLCLQTLPAVLPVTFGLLGEDVVFRTGTGTKLTAAVAHSVVVFEADHADIELGTGWSVCVTGRAETLHRPDDLAAVAELDIPTLVRGVASHVVRIHSDIVTGRSSPTG